MRQKLFFSEIYTSFYLFRTYKMSSLSNIDVYKRQAFIGENGVRKREVVYVSDHSTVAVSYTHLDVYKRQVYWVGVIL